MEFSDLAIPFLFVVFACIIGLGLLYMLAKIAGSFQDIFRQVFDARQITAKIQPQRISPKTAYFQRRGLNTSLMDEPALKDASFGKGKAFRVRLSKPNQKRV